MSNVGVLIRDMIYRGITLENILHTVNLSTIFTPTNSFLFTNKTEILQGEDVIEYNVKNKEIRSAYLSYMQTFCRFSEANHFFW